MAKRLNRMVADLKRQERALVGQLEKVRQAISLLEFGNQGVPQPAIIETPHAAKPVRRRSVRKRAARAATRKRVKR